MKKLKLISNLFWMIGFIILVLVVLDGYEIISIIPPGYIKQGDPKTLELIDTKFFYTSLFIIIGYIFLLSSIVLKLYYSFNKKDLSPIHNHPSLKHKNFKLVILIFKVSIFIATLCLIVINFLILVISNIDVSNIPG